MMTLSTTYEYNTLQITDYVSQAVQAVSPFLSGPIYTAPHVHTGFVDCKAGKVSNPA